jgi:hypothetical protein
MEASEEFTTIKGERPGGIPAVDGVIERNHVAPQLRMTDADYVVTVGDQDSGPEFPAQYMERLPERGPGVLLVEVRPEKSE